MTKKCDLLVSIVNYYNTEIQKIYWAYERFCSQLFNYKSSLKDRISSHTEKSNIISERTCHWLSTSIKKGLNFYWDQQPIQRTFISRDWFNLNFRVEPLALQRLMSCWTGYVGFDRNYTDWWPFNPYWILTGYHDNHGYHGYWPLVSCLGSKKCNLSNMSVSTLVSWFNMIQL